MKCKDVIGKLPANLRPREESKTKEVCVFCGTRSVPLPFSVCDGCWDEMSDGMKKLFGR